VANVLTLVLLGILLLVLVERGTHLTLPAALLAAICLVLIPLCGLWGMVYVPVMALWMGYAGVRKWLSSAPHAKLDSLVILALTILPLVGLYYYFQDYVFPYAAGSLLDQDVKPFQLDTVAKTAVQFLTVSLGHAAETLWPISGLAVSVL